mmetsp:Transcript_51610/g.105055  ORF Transcript_51610/g.105055 Transcript_51610/m.105055 type:complete len:209 (-) Transcript_51610:7-633(-)
MPTEVLREVPRLRVLHQTVAAGEVEEVLHHVPAVRWQFSLHPDCAAFAPIFCQAGASASVAAGEWLVFELLQPPQHTSEQVVQLLRSAKWPTQVGSKLLLENDLCRVWDFRMPPRGGSRLDFHQHVLSYAFVFLGHGKLEVFKPVKEGASISAEHCAVLQRAHLGVVWSERDADLVEADGESPKVPGALHSVENALDTEFREYMIELK